LVSSRNREVVTALREIAEGKVRKAEHHDSAQVQRVW
jgi:DNA-directed RNA polymerase subunit K/omega